MDPILHHLLHSNNLMTITISKPAARAFQVGIPQPPRTAAVRGRGLPGPQGLAVPGLPVGYAHTQRAQCAAVPDWQGLHKLHAGAGHESPAGPGPGHSGPRGRVSADPVPAAGPAAGAQWPVPAALCAASGGPVSEEGEVAVGQGKRGTLGGQ